MTFRLATIALAISAALMGLPQDASAQGRRAFGGFARGRPGFGAVFGRGFTRPYAGRLEGRPGFAPPGAYPRFAYPPPPPDPRRFGGYPEPAPAYGARAYPPAYAAPPDAAPFRFGGDWRQQQNEVRQAVREGRHIPLGQAIDAVRRRSPGRELDADIVPGPDGRADYRLRWAASDGRRIDYLVDAATGAIVGVEGGR